MGNNADYGAGQETLVKAAGHVTDAKAKFDKESKTLSGELEGMKVKWVGEGGTAFTNLHTLWIQKQTKILATLDQFADSLDTTDKTNKSNDSAQNQALAKIASILDG